MGRLVPMRRAPEGWLGVATRTAVPVVLMVGLAGCVGTATTTTASEPGSAVSSGAPRPAAPPSGPAPATTPPALPAGFRRCTQLLSTGVVDGPLSSDPAIAAAQQWRADNGLRSDEAWVRQVPGVARTSTMGFQYPTTDEEVTQLTSLGASVDWGALNAYTAQHRDTLGGQWIDHTTNSVTVSFTADVDRRRAEIQARIPGVRVIAANRTEAQLAEMQNKLTAELTARNLGAGSGVYIQAGGGVVGLVLFVLDEPSVRAVATFADPRLVCLDGPEPSQIPPPGPQRPAGPGWRLLGAEPVDVAFQAITDPATFAATWAVLAPGRPAPEVDLATTVVFALPTSGRGVTAEPCGSRFDGFTAGVGTIRFEIPTPGGAPVCDAVGRSGSYLVAVDRAALPTGAVTAEIHRVPSGPAAATIVVTL